MRAPFRIGIDPGWGADFDAMLGGAVRELLDPQDAIRWEMLEPPPGGIASAEVIDLYDGLIILQMGFDASSFAGVRRLACIARWGVGFDRIDIGAATAADVLVALTPESITRAVAESQLALIFALAKQLPALDKRTRGGLWRTELPIAGSDVAGKTLSSIGLGRIARELFAMARGIGFGRLLAYDPYCSPSQAREAGVELAGLDAVLAEGDFVTVNAFLDAGTRGLLGSREFALMKPTAYFVNTARGPIVQERALVEALRQGRIAGAGIDVFEQEPPPPNHALFSLDNVIVSPHAVAWTREGLAGNSRDACRNLLLVAAGQTPPCLAEPAAAQRAGVQAKLARWSPS